MKVTAITLLIINYIITVTTARLLEKYPEKTTPKIKAHRLNLIRVTRQINEEESSDGFSKEKNGEGNSEISPFDPKQTKTKPFIKPPEPTKAQFMNKRFLRESHEKQDTESKNVTQSDPASIKLNSVLVKKPTPNFKDIDYDENFQTKMYTGAPIAFRSVNSGEQADEDFNVDDYDFDVNHDEFSSRGKHIEPRQKHKIIKIDLIPEVKETATPESNIESVVVTKAVQQKRKIKKAADQTKEDYYDDINTTNKAPDKELEVNDESPESEYKEYDRKTTLKIESLLYPSYKLSKRALEGRDFRILPLFPVTQSDAIVTTSPVDNINY